MSNAYLMSAIIQDISFINGSEGKSVAIFIHLKTSDDLANFQIFCQREDNDSLEFNLGILTEFMVSMTPVNVISDPRQTMLLDGGLIIEAPCRNQRVELRGSNWHQVV